MVVLFGFGIDVKFIVFMLLVYLWIISSKENENVLIKNIIKKAKIYFDSIVFMILSKDSKGIGAKKNPDPDLINDLSNSKKTVVFIRHGESDWNNVFNKGINFSFISRLIRAIIKEILLYASPDSVFIDSPLNFEGIEQAIELRKFINSKNFTEYDPIYNIINTLAGKETNAKSVVVSSSLRRAVATTTLALWNRFEVSGEKLIILSSLQEISRNVDTFSLSAANSIADLPFSRVSPHCGGTEKFSPVSVFNTEENYGNKTRSFYGIKRLQAFNDWVFKRNEDIIIVGGHSLWFKAYFDTYLPHASKHEARSRKMTNSGVVAFEVSTKKLTNGVTMYRIDPTSVKVVYGGFMK
jgi:hypothetical protein